MWFTSKTYKMKGRRAICSHIFSSWRQGTFKATSNIVWGLTWKGTRQPDISPKMQGRRKKTFQSLCLHYLPHTKQHLPKARVESCSAATTLALYVKNFPGWPTLFPSHWNRPIRELAYTVTYYFDTMNDLNMYAIYLPELNGLRGRMDKTLAFWSWGREFKPRSWQLFFCL